MPKIIGTSTWTNSTTNHISTSNISWLVSPTTQTQTIYICPADGNVYTLENGERKRMYCSPNCRFKMAYKRRKKL